MKKIIRKNIRLLLTILIIDVIIIGGWIFYIKPSDDMAIILIFAIPVVIVLNLLLAIIFIFFKKNYTPFLLLNIIIAPVMLYGLFVSYIHIKLTLKLEKWEFFIEDMEYSISYLPEQKPLKYSITYSPEPGLSIGGNNGRGVVALRNDTIFFTSIDSITYYIYKDYLHDFKYNNSLHGFKDIDKIKVKKKY